MFKFKLLNVICYKFNLCLVFFCFVNFVKKKKYVSNECKNICILILFFIIGKKKNLIILICYGIYFIILKVIFISLFIFFIISCVLSYNEIF